MRVRVREGCVRVCGFCLVSSNAHRVERLQIELVCYHHGRIDCAEVSDVLFRRRGEGAPRRRIGGARRGVRAPRGTTHRPAHVRTNPPPSLLDAISLRSGDMLCCDEEEEKARHSPPPSPRSPHPYPWPETEDGSLRKDEVRVLPCLAGLDLRCTNCETALLMRLMLRA